MKSPSNPPVPTNRRNFLLGATLASAGAVAAVVTGRTVAEKLELSVVESKPAKPTGYRLTPHIAKYYQTTKL